MGTSGVRRGLRGTSALGAEDGPAGRLTRPSAPFSVGGCAPHTPVGGTAGNSPASAGSGMGSDCRRGSWFTESSSPGTEWGSAPEAQGPRLRQRRVGQPRDSPGVMSARHTECTRYSPEASTGGTAAAEVDDGVVLHRAGGAGAAAVRGGLPQHRGARGGGATAPGCAAGAGGGAAGGHELDSGRSSSSRCRGRRRRGRCTAARSRTCASSRWWCRRSTRRRCTTT